MHIELTDHLRCPRDHVEAFLVLLPDRMEQRRIAGGHLGCPVCGWSTAWTDFVPDFGDGWRANGTLPFDATGAQAMLGLDGPGGWVALAGNAGSLAPALATLLPGVAIVAVNPAADIVPDIAISVVVSGAWPIKTHSMRGVVLGSDATTWRDVATASALPGLRVVGSGEPPAETGVQLLADAGGIWVAKHR